MKKEIPVNKKVGRNILPTIRGYKPAFFIDVFKVFNVGYTFSTTTAVP